MSQESLKVRLLGDATSLNASLSASQKKLQSFGKSVTKIGQEMSLKFTLPLGLAGGAAIKMASDFEETDAKFNTVFSSMQEQANATAKTFKESFGLSSLAAKDLLSNTGDLLVGFGFAESEALNLSKQVNELAVDLASFTNFSGGAEGASQALTKALLGERESIKSLGIAITETDLKEFAADQGLVFKELDRVAKATLTYELAAKQSSKAIGDFSRTQDSFANQMRQLKGDVSDVAVEFGKILLPIAKDLVKLFRDFAKRLEDMSPAMKKITLLFAGITGAIGPVLIVVGKLSLGLSAILGVLPKVRVAFIALTTAMKANPFILVGTAIAGLVIKLQSLKRASDAAKLDAFGEDIKKLKLDEAESKLAKLTETFEANKKIIEDNNKLGLARKKIILEDADGVKRKASEIEKENTVFGQQIKLLEDFIKLKKEEQTLTTTTPDPPSDPPGSKRSQVSSVSSLDTSGLAFGGNLANMFTGADPATLLAESVAKGNILLQEKLTETEQIQRAKALQFQQNAQMMNEGLSNIVTSGLNNMAVGLGNALGDAISGAGKGVASLGSILLGGIGTMAVQLGQLAVQIGIGLIAIKEAFKSLGGFGAIAAGIALIALGKLFQNKARAIGEAKGKGPVAFAKGGIVSSPTLGLVGEYSGARSNPEVIAPLDRLKSMIGDRGQSVNVSGEFSLKGQDLVVALQRANRNRDRII